MVIYCSLFQIAAALTRLCLLRKSRKLPAMKQFLFERQFVSSLVVDASDKLKIDK